MLIESGPFAGPLAYMYSAPPAQWATQEDAWSRADWVGTPRTGARQSGPGMSVLTGEELARYCFGDIEHLPQWLLNPGDALQAAADPSQGVDRQLACLLQMMDEVDTAFSQHLVGSASAPTGGDSHAQEARSPGSRPTLAPHALQMLPRWIEALFAGGAALLRRQILPRLVTSGLRIMPVTHLDETQIAWLHRYFTQRIYPLLTPLAVDPGHPFPFISSESVNLLVELGAPQGQKGSLLAPQKHLLARVKIPTTTAQWIPVPPSDPAEAFGPDAPAAVREAGQRAYRNGSHAAGQHSAGRNGGNHQRNRRPKQPQIYVATADVVRYFVHHLFRGMPVRHVYLFRLLRADLRMAEEVPQAGYSPRRQQIEQPAARLDVERRMPDPLLEWLLGHVGLPAYAVARHDNLLEWLSLPHLAAHIIDGLTSPLPGAGQIPKID